MASRRARRLLARQDPLAEPAPVDPAVEIKPADVADSEAKVVQEEGGAPQGSAGDASHGEDAGSDSEDRRLGFVSVNDLHRGCYVLMKGQFPCKIVEVNRSKQGKHGSAKVSITALDIFTHKKYEDLYPSSKNVEVPEVVKTELEVIGPAGDNQLAVRNVKDGKPHAAVVIPDDEVGERIRSLLAARTGVLVQLQASMGQEKLVMARERKVR